MPPQAKACGYVFGTAALLSANSNIEIRNKRQIPNQKFKNALVSPVSRRRDLSTMATVLDFDF